MHFGRSKKRVVSRGLTAIASKRLRIRWGRLKSHTHLSHLDNIRAMENAIRQSGIPIIYSQGKHPRMKLSFSPPLPVGFTSETEFVDMNLELDLSSQMINKLNKSMPDGFEVLEAATVFAGTASLTEAINRVVYTLRTDDNIDTQTLQSRIDNVLNKCELIVTRKTKSGEKQVDIRKAIIEIKQTDGLLSLTLGIGQEGYVRPTEVARILFEMDETEVSQLRFHRKELFRQVDEKTRIPAIEL